MKTLTLTALAATLLLGGFSNSAGAHDYNHSYNYNYNKNYQQNGYYNQSAYNWNNYRYKNTHNNYIRAGYVVPRHVQTWPVERATLKYLRKAPKGYEYRQTQGKILLINAHTGVVKDIIRLSYR
ncbi:MAG: hypothetical protein RBR86_04080 [Pseudobdellovibrionaceae bacterium]|jgi:hypothetical protein|nr:hypothetical protein [Pseudobdellovibrionaceae bacterium]